MTFEEYNKKLDEYEAELKDDDTVLDKISELQYGYMRNVIKQYNADSPAKEVCRELLDYAVNYSQSGSSIYYVDSKELAEEVNEIIWEELGDYLLDCEVYEDNEEWAIDCVFGGYFVPDWDGWLD